MDLDVRGLFCAARVNHDFLDDLADLRKGVVAVVLVGVGQRLLQVLHHAAVHVARLRMEFDWRRGDRRQLGLDLVALGFQLGQAGLQRAARRAGEQCVDGFGNRAGDSPKPLVETSTPVGRSHRQFPHGLVIFPDIFRDQLRGGELRLDAVEHAGLEILLDDRQPVVAQAGFAHPRAAQDVATAVAA